MKKLINILLLFYLTACKQAAQTKPTEESDEVTKMHEVIIEEISKGFGPVPHQQEFKIVLEEKENATDKIQK